MSYDPIEAAHHAAEQLAREQFVHEQFVHEQLVREQLVREQLAREQATQNQVCPGGCGIPSLGGVLCQKCIGEERKQEGSHGPFDSPPEVYEAPPTEYGGPTVEGAQHTNERDDGELQELPWVYVPSPDEGAEEEKLEAKNICPVCSTKTPGGTRCQACLNNELLAFYHDSPEVFGQKEFISGERDFMPPEEWIDMREAPEGSARTADGGHKRNGRWFWNEMLWLHPEFFSEDNRKYIEARFAPMVDKQWLEYHEAHEMFEGDLLVHHHVDRGPMAAGVPEELHRIFHGPLHFV
jgi:hypothetical protein